MREIAWRSELIWKATGQQTTREWVEGKSTGKGRLDERWRIVAGGYVHCCHDITLTDNG